MNMINGQTISIIFSGVFLALTLIGLLKGFGSGAGRQTVRAVTIAVSIIISLIATGGISGFIASLCADKTLDEVLMVLGLHQYVDGNTLELLACFDAVTAERIVELPLMAILMPFIFTTCFVSVSTIMLIVHAVFCFIFRLSGKSAGVGSRLIGMLIGTIQGAAVAMIFLLPIMNVVGIASDTNDQIVEHHDGDVSEVQFCQLYDTYVRDTRESPIFATAYALGGDVLCDHFATINVEGVEENLRDTTSMVLVATDDFMALDDFDWTAPTADQCDALKAIIDKLDHDPYIASLLSGTMRGIATAIESGVVVLDLEEPVLGVMNNLMRIFTTLNSENFATDIDTILEVYFLLSREGVLTSLTSGSTEEITAAFIQEDEEGVTVIRRIIVTIQDNPHMKPLVTMLTKLSVSIMMNNVGVENGDAVYDSIKDGVQGVIEIDKSQYETEEEYVGAVSESLDSTLKDHDIVLAPEIVDNMAQYVADNYSDLEEISDDEVNDTILSYYEAYMQYVNGGGENPFPGILPDNPDEGTGTINPDDLPEGINPDDLPEGINPDDLPEGINPDDLPEGINPDDLPEGIIP